jgi:hypothetical protein
MDSTNETAQNDNSDKPNAQQKYEWNDRICNEMSKKEFFPSSVLESSVQKNIISRFFDFYLGAKRQPGISVSDLVFAVLSIVPVTPQIDSNVWSNKQYVADGALFVLPEKKEAVPAVPSEKQPAEADPLNVIKETAEELIESPIEDIISDNESVISTELNLSKSSSSHSSLDSLIQVLECSDSEPVNSKHETIQPNGNFQNITIEFPTSVQWFSNKPQAQTRICTLIQYGPVENLNFIRTVSELLQVWDTNSAARAMLKYFFAVIALVLMRATTKSYKHLVNTFCNEKFLPLIKFSQRHITYCTPHKRCLKAAYRTFLRRDRNTPVMFAKIIVLYMSLNEKHKLKLTIRNAVLLHTSGYGLNLVNLWRLITQEMEIKDVQAIGKLSLTPETRKSWERLIDFFEKTKGQTLFYWARVLNWEYFKQLSCQQNYELAVILGVFVEKITGNSSLWESSWVNKDGLDEAKEIGYSLYEVYSFGKTNLL